MCWVLGVGCWLLIDLVQLPQGMGVLCWELDVGWSCPSSSVAVCLVLGVWRWVLGVGCLVLADLVQLPQGMGVWCWLLDVG